MRPYDYFFLEMMRPYDLENDNNITKITFM